MNDPTGEQGMESCAYRSPGLWVRLLGVFYLAFGAANALLAPAEMYVFYLFSPGGRLHYEGFGIGAFMFANVAAQITGYSLLAALFLPLGYGHWRRRGWAIDLAQAALWCWLAVGLPLGAAALFVYVTSKEPSPAAAVIALLLLALFYLVIPWLMLHFYRSAGVQRAVDPPARGGGAVAGWTVALLCLFYAAALWALIFFNGAFPLFGRLLTGLPGILCIDVAVLLLLALAWGACRRRLWAWWGALALFGGLALSSLLTLQRYPLGALLAEMRFAPLEMQAFLNVPFQELRFTLFAALPLALTLAVLLASRRAYFQPAPSYTAV